MLQNKQVYIIETSIIVKLKDKEPLIYKSGKEYSFSRYIYKYGEVPEPNYELYDNPNTVWNIFLRKLGYDVYYHGEKLDFLKEFIMMNGNIIIAGFIKVNYHAPKGTWLVKAAS